jgi:hypothetical protein
VRQILEEIGLEGRRIQMINISAAMGGQFAFAAAEMTAEIKQLGPSPLRRAAHVPLRGTAGESDPELKAEAEAAFSDTPDLTARDPA